MSYVILKLSTPLNASVEIGDVAYYSILQNIDGTDFSSGSNYNLIGEIQDISIDNQIATIKCNFEGQAPGVNDFIFFVKSKIVNTSSIKGYYGIVNFINTSSFKSEMYSSFCEVAESSK